MTAEVSQGPERTPDGHYIVVRGRLWRATNPNLPVKRREQLVATLMDARRQLRGQAAPEIRAAARSGGRGQGRPGRARSGLVERRRPGLQPAHGAQHALCGLVRRARGSLVLTGLKFLDGLLEASGCRRRHFTASPLQQLDQRPAQRRRSAALLGERFQLDLSEDRDLSRDGLAGADSTGQRNGLTEHLSRRLVVQRLQPKAVTRIDLLFVLAASSIARTS